MGSDGGEGGAGFGECGCESRGWFGLRIMTCGDREREREREGIIVVAELDKR